MAPKLLSICIPTRGRIDVLNNTLRSIYNSKVDLSDFEVVIYDSSDDDALSVLLAKEYKYSNLIYRKGKNNGFLNLISALELGNGLFLKLHNDYTMLNDEGLIKMLARIRNELTKKSILFFANGSIISKASESFTDFDSFMKRISFYSSWSTAFGIWKSDFERIKMEELNIMFPHTSLLMLLYDKKSYWVNNEFLFTNQEIPKKGGYNLFKTFCIDYLNMLNFSLRKGHITCNTFILIKKQMYTSFLIPWYYATKVKRNNYTFELTNIKESMKVHYSAYYYYLMVIMAWSLYPIKRAGYSILKVCKSKIGL